MILCRLEGLDFVKVSVDRFFVLAPYFAAYYSEVNICFITFVSTCTPTTMGISDKNNNLDVGGLLHSFQLVHRLHEFLIKIIISMLKVHITFVLTCTMTTRISD